MIGDAIGANISGIYAAQQQAAYNQSLGQLQQAGLKQMHRYGLGGERVKTREEKILDMECDLSNYLNRSKDLQI